MELKLPHRVTVVRVLESRYPKNLRPDDWDRRIGGLDHVETEEGLAIKLQSNGQQSPPQPGWTILLTSGDQQSGYVWTLYGMSALRASTEDIERLSR